MKLDITYKDNTFRLDKFQLAEFQDIINYIKQSFQFQDQLFIMSMGVTDLKNIDGSITFYNQVIQIEKQYKDTENLVVKCNIQVYIPYSSSTQQSPSDDCGQASFSFISLPKHKKNEEIKPFNIGNNNKFIQLNDNNSKNNKNKIKSSDSEFGRPISNLFNVQNSSIYIVQNHPNLYYDPLNFQESDYQQSSNQTIINKIVRQSIQKCQKQQKQEQQYIKQREKKLKEEIQIKKNQKKEIDFSLQLNDIYGLGVFNYSNQQKKKEDYRNREQNLSKEFSKNREQNLNRDKIKFKNQKQKKQFQPPKKNFRQDQNGNSSSISTEKNIQKTKQQYKHSNQNHIFSCSCSQIQNRYIQESKGEQKFLIHTIQQALQLQYGSVSIQEQIKLLNFYQKKNFQLKEQGNYQRVEKTGKIKNQDEKEKNSSQKNLPIFDGQRSFSQIEEDQNSQKILQSNSQEIQDQDQNQKQVKPVNKLLKKLQKNNESLPQYDKTFLIDSTRQQIHILRQEQNDMIDYMQTTLNSSAQNKEKGRSK